MTTREIGRHTPSVYDYYVSRPRTVSSRIGGLQVRADSRTNGNQSCTIRFFKGETLVYEEVSRLLMSGAAKLAYTAYQEAVENWRNKASYAPMELKKAGYGLDPNDWDQAEVNGKSFPRI